jgi:hypothetical protein
MKYDIFIRCRNRSGDAVKPKSMKKEQFRILRELRLGITRQTTIFEPEMGQYQGNGQVTQMPWSKNSQETRSRFGCGDVVGEEPEELNSEEVPYISRVVDSIAKRMGVSMRIPLSGFLKFTIKTYHRI